LLSIYDVYLLITNIVPEDKQNMISKLKLLFLPCVLIVPICHYAYGKTDINVNQPRSVSVAEASSDTPDNYNPAGTKRSYEKVEVISRGKLIDLIDYLEPGKYTAFLFYADWCGPCRILKPKLEEFAEKSDRFALREIDIINWENPLVRYYDLHSIPSFIIYGPNGKFVESGPGITNETMKAISNPD
jgi:thiol-disulfide isomerase/thioredoxin